MKLYIFASVLLFAACAGGDEDIKEPVAQDVDTSIYPDDPAMAEDGNDTGDEPSPFGSEGEPEDGVGELTDEPFSESDATSDFSASDSAELGDDSGEPDPVPESDMQDLYQESFEDQPGYDVTEPIADGAVVPDSAFADNDGGVDSFADSEGGGDGEVTRYVDALLLNVRSSPTFGAPVIRRLLGGAKINVTIEGRFAKIRAGQYVSTKYLSTSPTRKVTRKEVTDAWRKSKYKDTWVPPR